MSNFRILEHTSDLGLEAQGKTLREAFVQAAIGLFSIIAKWDSIHPKKSCAVEVEGETPEELLVAWLNRLIYLYDSEKIILTQFDILKLSGNRLKARVSGEPMDYKKHEILTYVKAATHHRVLVSKEKPFTVRVYFDV